MEFSEKLQQLRKSRGLTQEELAEALYVSRTAVSKWESGRGYPSIDSIKEIARYFSVSIDDLLSGEKILSIAEKENQSNIRSLCDLLFGIADLMAVTLIILPLYPDRIGGQVDSVNLLAYTQAAPWVRLTDWVLFSALIVTGAVKILLRQRKTEKGQKLIADVSIALGILSVLFLAMTGETYATAMAFFLLILKGTLVLKRSKTNG